MVAEIFIVVIAVARGWQGKSRSSHLVPPAQNCPDISELFLAYIDAKE